MGRNARQARADPDPSTATALALTLCKNGTSDAKQTSIRIIHPCISAELSDSQPVPCCGCERL